MLSDLVPRGGPQMGHELRGTKPEEVLYGSQRDFLGPKLTGKNGRKWQDALFIGVNISGCYGAGRKGFVRRHGGPLKKSEKKTLGHFQFFPKHRHGSRARKFRRPGVTSLWGEGHHLKA